VVLRLPPPAAWAARTQTLSIQGSTNGSSFSTVVGGAPYTFDPNTGNAVTITFLAKHPVCPHQRDRERRLARRPGR
jgi:hypothetical protein